MGMMRVPEKQGLYDPRNEHDACGIGVIAHKKGKKSHSIIQQGLQILANVDHRGARGADPELGDGVGGLYQIPDELLRAWAVEKGIDLPPVGKYGVGMLFFPQDEAARTVALQAFKDEVAKDGHEIIGWREVPTNDEAIGKTALSSKPIIHQAIIKPRADLADKQDDFERRLFTVLQKTEVRLQEMEDQHPSLKTDFYIASLSSRTIVYKGLILADKLGAFFRDLMDPRFTSAIALMHQRFSTNTFPSWKLAHPYRLVVHNGEINTVQGNENSLEARRKATTTPLIPEFSKLGRLIRAGQSDTAAFDKMLNTLIAGGYSMPEAMAMMIPQAWQGNPYMDPELRAFYEYKAAIVEAWDGPAHIVASDGRHVIATLDRNGLRPARYLETDDDIVVLASEDGVLPIPEEKITKKWRLQPGKMLNIDLEEGRIIDDAELKANFAKARDYGELLKKHQIGLADLPAASAVEDSLSNQTAGFTQEQKLHGITDETVKFFLEPMAQDGDDPVGSMGMDIPPAVLSDNDPSFFDFFKQRFAQVTNPPIDAIREEMVMALQTFVGPKPNLFDTGETPQTRLQLKQPILTNKDLATIKNLETVDGHPFKPATIDTTWAAEEGAAGLEKALAAICEQAALAVRTGQNIIVLSDRAASENRIPIPSLLATSAVHQHLIREGLRSETGLVVEAGDAHEVHHMSVLAGYGAEAINPYMAFKTIKSIAQQLDKPAEKAEAQYIKALNKGFYKVMSKMGISTYQSYCGAQIFDAVGISQELLDAHFTGTSSAVGGYSLGDIAAKMATRHQRVYGNDPFEPADALKPGGDFQQRLEGERHQWIGDSVANLQHAVRRPRVDGKASEQALAEFRQYSQLMNGDAERANTFRALFDVKKSGLPPVPIDEVEPVTEIVKRFATGAMSYGSISRKAHTTLAIGMNRIGGKSNTGEGGEEADRFQKMANGDSMRSAIKQVASGRFGVTIEYLVNADVLQIKMAQGAKPGEGGQLPGSKVSGPIARVRFSTPGVGLISPPPHHDIYSIEDLAQLIHDLKNANPNADISVKLVSEVGVGTIAAGVAKARADHVTIAGYEGGTGASPLTSLKHAGSPWEIGLAETHQTLVMNGLRDRIAVQVDGGLRTSRDVIIGGLLGADEFGFATAPLIAMGCIMMRKCHLNTCPVGIATQDPVLLGRFKGEPEHVINFFFMLGEEIRAFMAENGFRKFDELVGRRDMIDATRALAHYQKRGLDFSKLLMIPKAAEGVGIHHSKRQNHGLEGALDQQLIKLAENAIKYKQRVVIDMDIKNTNRTVGAMLSNAVADEHKYAGLPEDTIHINLKGTAGQSFGAFLAHGVTLELEGTGNDGVGKSNSGGIIIIKQPPAATRDATENIIVGNNALYGAISGQAYFNGVAGERFAVRNSGATTVVEGVGDHGCEYMTGGAVVVLGQTGRNFAAGMSGGVAYVYDPYDRLKQNINPALCDAMSPLEVANDSGDAAARPRATATTLKDSGVMANMLEDDEERLRNLIERHHEHTGSKRAKYILDNWREEAGNFKRILPPEYRHALLNPPPEESAKLVPA